MTKRKATTVVEKARKECKGARSCPQVPTNYVWGDPGKVSSEFGAYVSSITAHTPDMSQSQYKKTEQKSQSDPIPSSYHKDFPLPVRTSTLHGYLKIITRSKVALAIIAHEVKPQNGGCVRSSSPSLYTACLLMGGKGTSDMCALKSLFAGDMLTENNWIQCYNSLSVLLPPALHNVKTELVYRTQFTKIGRQQSIQHNWTPKFPVSFLRHVDREAQIAASSAGLDWAIDGAKKRFDRDSRMGLIDNQQYNVDEMKFSELEKLAKLLEGSNSFIDKILLVQLATGARFIEVCRVSEFKLPIEDLNFPDTASFHGKISIIGIAKAPKYNSAGTEIKDPVVLLPKPTLFITPSDVKSHVAGIRPNVLELCNKRSGEAKEDIKDYTNEFVTATVISLALDRLMSHGIKCDGYVLSTHMLRKLYANASFSLHAPRSMTKVAWIKEVLGHTNYNSVLSYNSIKLGDM